MREVNKKVTVIVPVYNVEPYLNKCVDSILAQTYRNIEVILIDDGSTDGCGEICDSYKERDERVKVFHTENRGLSAARNLGIQNADGEFIYFIDSDDWIDDNLLKTAVEKIGGSNVLCFCQDEGEYSGLVALKALINGKIGYSVWSKVFRKDCFFDIKFPEGRIIEDIATVYKIIYASKTVKFVIIKGYHYRNRQNSITHIHDIANIMGYWLAAKEQYEYCKDLVDQRTRINLLKICAIAVGRAWAWRKECNHSELQEWENMSVFSKTMFPFSVWRKYSARIIGGLFFARFNNRLSFELAYRLNMLTRKRR